MPAIRLLLLFISLSASCNTLATAKQLGPDRWTGIPRIVAFGDVHGAYDQLITGLTAAGVIDAKLTWTGADTHLVSLGDLLDRGADSRKVMDLLMALESQAAAVGGRVHVVMGNHELMNLTGDLRYVSAEEFAAFAPEETGAARAAAFDGFLRRRASAATASETDPDDARREFDARFPPGYFGLRAQFAPESAYGAWLLQRPLMVVLNETAFVHGGLPPVTAQMSLEELNAGFTADVSEIIRLGARLARAGWIRRDRDLLAQDNAIVTRIDAAPEGEDPDLLAAARRFVALTRGELFGNMSPNWYRGTARCHGTLEQPVVAAALENLGARRVVVGHTPTSNSRVQQRLDGRALLADTGMLASYYGGQPAPVIFTGGELEILYPLQEESAKAPDFVHPLQLHGLPPDALERFLSTARVARVDTAEPAESNLAVNPQTVTLELDDRTVNAFFEPGSRQSNDHKIAAYRLSRMLNLNLVPVTVARTVQGKQGVLMALPPDHLSEAARNAAQIGRSNWCGVGNDYQLMYAFDALILNEQRTTESMVYDQQNWQLYLTGHGDSFATRTATPRYLANIRKILPGAFRGALEALKEDQLTPALAEQLSKREIRALLKRRDALLENWTEAQTQ